MGNKDKKKYMKFFEKEWLNKENIQLSRFCKRKNIFGIGTLEHLKIRNAIFFIIHLDILPLYLVWNRWFVHELINVTSSWHGVFGVRYESLTAVNLIWLESSWLLLTSRPFA